MAGLMLLSFAAIVFAEALYNKYKKYK